MKSIQIWPRGHQLIYSGEPNDSNTVRIHKSFTDKRGRKAKPEEVLDIRVEQCAERLMAEEVWCCDSSLVTDLMKMDHEDGNDVGTQFDWDKVSNLRPDPSDWTIEECKDWLEEEGYDLPDTNPWAMDRKELRNYLGDEQQKGSDEEYLDAALAVMNEDVAIVSEWRDAVNDNATDAEIFEWWRVSKWLAESLNESGYCVLDNDYGYWWGRTTTGQAMQMDGVFQKIARSWLK